MNIYFPVYSISEEKKYGVLSWSLSYRRWSYKECDLENFNSIVVFEGCTAAIVYLNLCSYSASYVVYVNVQGDMCSTFPELVSYLFAVGSMQ